MINDWENIACWEESKQSETLATKFGLFQIELVGLGWVGTPEKIFNYFPHLTLSSMGLFEAAQGWGEGVKKNPLPKACDSYPTMMKLGTVILYLKKIKKIHESRDTRLEFCCHQHFVTRYQQILLTKKYG